MGGLTSKVLIEQAKRTQAERLRRLEAQRIQARPTTADQIQANIIKIEQICQERLAQEQLRAQKLKQKQHEAEKLKQEQIVADQLKQEQHDAEPLKQQDQFEAKLSNQKQHEVRLLKQYELEAEQLKQKQLEAEQLKQKQLEAEQLKQKQLEAEQLKQKQLEAERLKQYHLEAEQLKQKQLEAEQLESERLQKYHLEAEQLKQKQLEAEQLRQYQVKVEQLKQKKIQAERMKTEQNQTEQTRSKQAIQAIQPDGDKNLPQVLQVHELWGNWIKYEQIKAKQINQEQLESKKHVQLQVKTEQILADKLQAKQHSTGMPQVTELFTYSRPVDQNPQSLRLPCRNAGFGCTSLVPDGELLAHSKACLYRPYHCPMDLCLWQGNYSKLYCHAEEMHARFTGMHFGQNYRVLLGYDTMLLRHEELVFRLYARPTQCRLTMCWALQLLGPPAEAANWKYEIQIKKDDHVKRLQISDMCLHEDEDVDKVLNEEECPSMPFKVLANFLKKNRISFRLLVCNKSKPDV